MQTLIDFLPLIAFFVSYKLAGIYVATGVLIAATGLQIAWHWWRFGKVKALHWITAVLVLLFGSATLLLHDPHFIQWKPSVLMWLLGAAFLVSQFVGAKPLSQRFLETTLKEATQGAGGRMAQLSAGAWSRLNLAWVGFFVLTGCANLYVARTFSESVWVNFKVWGLGLLTLAFILPQIIWLMPRGNEENVTR